MIAITFINSSNFCSPPQNKLTILTKCQKTPTTRKSSLHFLIKSTVCHQWSENYNIFEVVCCRKTCLLLFCFAINCSRSNPVSFCLQNVLFLISGSAVSALVSWKVSNNFCSSEVVFRILRFQTTGVKVYIVSSEKQHIILVAHVGLLCKRHHKACLHHIHMCNFHFTSLFLAKKKIKCCGKCGSQF